MARKNIKKNIAKVGLVGSGAALFLHGVVVYGPQVDSRIHHWQVGLGLILLGLLI